MRKNAFAALLCAVLGAASAAAQETEPNPDEFAFFRNEERVVTASRRPAAMPAAPATVYVVTSEQIRASGAQTLWDALRSVPGVDVMNDRTSHADIAIRGMNKVLNNRTLVLLDGKTVLNGFYDYTNWETIPVTLEEIDRIEVVEGPASALYGSNAMQGVINIITKTPDQLRGGVASVTAGERDTFVGQAVAGGRRGAHAYKVGAGWRSTDRFGNAHQEASAVAKAHALWSWDFADDSQWSVSGGVSNHDVNLSNGPSNDDGNTGFLRTDLRVGQTAARFFWNAGAGQFRDNPTIPFHLRYDTYDASLERSFDLPRDNALTAGASYRRNTAESDVFAPGKRDQALYALYFEDSWAASERWTFVGSARADRHPFTKWQFAPRASAIFTPNERHSLRATAASAYRNPTLLENYFDLSASIPVTNPPGFTSADVRVLPNTGLEAESIQFLEVAHRGSFDRLKTGVTGFYYRITKLARGLTTIDATAAPVLKETVMVTNGGETKALGAELSVEYQALAWLAPYANYSYQSLVDQDRQQTTARSAPMHKVNFGARAKGARWTAAAEASWVDATWWSDGTSSLNPVYARVPAYFVLNLAATRRLTGRYEGFEVTVAGSNIADRHYELLPRQSATAAGQNGGPIDQRWSGTLAYRFGGKR